MARRALLALLVTVSVLPCALASSAQDPASSPAPVVAAASDLQFALPEIAAAFERDTGQRVRLSFGSSGNLARQVEQGAPFELFFSADEAFIERLVAGGRTRDGGALYGIGRIVLFAPHGSPLELDPAADGLRTLLRAGRAWRFAIANPEHAPYGRAAQQALESLGLWESLQPRLVLGENVSQAAQFATSGNAAGGIIAYSLVLAPEVAARGRYVLLPEALHQPLRQRMVLTRRAGATAQRFYEYVQAPAARAVLVRYGFALPEP
jgi:molybdate transport system substrate-binding protein